MQQHILTITHPVVFAVNQGKNLLVELDKIEKTAGMQKIRRRNSISLGELYEADKFNLEHTRNGVIQEEVMHSG